MHHGSIRENYYLTSQRSLIPFGAYLLCTHVFCFKPGYKECCGVQQVICDLMLFIWVDRDYSFY